MQNAGSLNGGPQNPQNFQSKQPDFQSRIQKPDEVETLKRKSLGYYTRALELYIKRRFMESASSIIQDAANGGITDSGFYITAFDAYIKAEKYKLAMELVKIVYKAHTTAKIKDKIFYDHALTALQDRITDEEGVKELNILFAPVISYIHKTEPTNDSSPEKPAETG